MAFLLYYGGGIGRVLRKQPSHISIYRETHEQIQQFDPELHLAQIEHLFTIPDATPLSAQWCNRSGIEQIYNEWIKARPREPGALTIHLPDEGLPTEMTNHVRAAIQRYCEQEIESEQSTVTFILGISRRAIIVGVIILGLFLTLSAVVRNIAFLPNWLATLLAESLLVAAWVAAWRPVDLRLYEWRPHRFRIRFLEYLREMELIIERLPSRLPDIESM